MFELIAPYSPAGDQPQAIEKLVAGIQAGAKHQVLLGVTGSGKTYTIANVIQQIQRPTLVISHNITLAAQLYAEFKSFFPKNAVEYFVSYFDYYQPEAYIPRSDTFIEKDSSRNDEIERLRLSTMSSLFSIPESLNSRGRSRVKSCWPSTRPMNSRRLPSRWRAKFPAELVMPARVCQSVAVSGNALISWTRRVRSRA